jgi:hypothetical protein
VHGRCGYSRGAELQQLVVRAIANLALEPELNRMLEAEGVHQLLLSLVRSKHADVVHWAHVAQGNLEAASALGPLIKHCPADNLVEPVDMLTMSALVAHLRSTDARSTLAVRRLTAAAVANLLVSPHNQRLVLECNGIKPLVTLAQEGAIEPELQAQCMRAIANLAVTAEYRPNLLQARALALVVGTLRGAQMQSDGTHTFVVLTHAARALGNMCAGGDVASAMQQKAAAEGAITVLLPLLTRTRDHLQDLRKARIEAQACHPPAHTHWTPSCTPHRTPPAHTPSDPTPRKPHRTPPLTPHGTPHHRGAGTPATPPRRPWPVRSL